MNDKVTTYDRLRTFYVEGDESVLLPGDKAILARWEEAFTFIRDTKNISQSVAMLQRRFPDVSRRTLYRDVNDALRLFGNIMEYSKEAMRNMINEYTLDYLNRCKSVGDRANESRALAILVKNNNTDKDNEGQIDPSQFLTEPPVIEIPTEVVGALNALLMRGSVNLMELRARESMLIEDGTRIQPTSTTTGDSSTT